MSLNNDWVPMKWPCGPLEIARRSQAQTLRADTKQTLEAWCQPSALHILKGTPVNCLIVEWAHGEPEDSAQQHTLKPLLEAGRETGISFIGKISTRQGAGAAVAAGREAGPAAVMVAGPSAQSSVFPVVLQSPRDKVEWEATSSIFSLTDGIWPGLALETMKGDTAISGPTGIPWVNSNAWLSLLSRELTGGKTLWLDFDPPETVLHASDYCIALADSRAYRSRWIISLSDRARAGVLNRNSEALGVWNELCETAAFFEDHKEWEKFVSQGILAVISDFRGDNAFLGGEVLNLLNRAQVQFRVVEKSRTLAVPTEGLRAILWLDKEGPGADQRTKLLDFTKRGGLLLAPAYWGPPGVKPSKRGAPFNYDMYNIGQGQIAVAEVGFQDPYQVSVDTHLLVSRRNDLVRLFNPAATNCCSSVDPAHKKLVVQVLNYSSTPADSLTVWVNTRAHTARLWNSQAKDSAPIQGVAASPGMEFRLPTLPVYCALEIEG